MSADSTMCHVYAMNRDGDWFSWTLTGWGGDTEMPHPLPQAEAVEKARYAMNNISWVWGVQVDVLDEPE